MRRSPTTYTRPADCMYCRSWATSLRRPQNSLPVTFMPVRKGSIGSTP